MVRTLLRRISIRTLLILLFVTIIVLDVGLTGYLSFRTGQRAVTELAHRLQSETTARIEEHLQGYLKMPHLLNQINLDAISLGQIDLDDLSTLEPHFWQQLRRFGVSSVAYADEQGTYFGVSHEVPGGAILLGVTERITDTILQVYTTDSQGRRIDITESYPGYDPRPRPWYQQAVRAGGPSWTPTFVWTNGLIGIDAVIPVYNSQQQLRGVLDISLTLEDISQFLQQLKVGTTGTTYIIDRSGFLIASSASEPPYIKTQDVSSQLSVLDSQTPMLQESAMALERDYGGFAAIQTQETFTIDGINDTYLVQATPYRDPYGLDWLIVVVVPEGDFMGPIKITTITTAFLVLISLLLAIVLAIGVADGITRPILALNQAAKDLAAGRWEQRLPQVGVREVSELSASFHSMVEQLQATFANLQTKEQRLREALDAANMGTWDWNITNGSIIWSEQVAPQFGLKPGEYNGGLDEYLTLIYPDDRQLMTDQINACLEHGRPTFHVEHRVIWPDGSMHWLEGKGQAVRDSAGQPLHLRGTVTEITARKQADAALRESQERYRIISELVSSYAYAYCCNSDGTLELEWVTESFTRITGYGVRMLGKITEWDSVISAADRWRISRHRAQILEGKAADMVEYAITASDGRLIWLREYQRPIWDPEVGRVVRIYGAAQDITRFKQLERQLHEAQRMEAIGRLAGGIAHDFNNLLTIILGICSLIIADIEQDTSLQNDVMTIQDAAMRASMMTRQLLAFSRQQMLQPRILALNAVVMAMGQLLQRLIGEDITLELQLDPQIGNIQADPSQLEQVIMNLAINARDAMPQGGTLIVKTAEIVHDERHWAQISVSDTGVGMDRFTQAHLFEPFFTTKGLGKGTGLGLATVHGIVLQSGGKIDVESALGQGTTFTILLPLLDDAGGEPAMVPDIPAVPMGVGTVLVVEDDGPVRELIARVLRQYGYTIIEASGGTQALEIIEQTVEGIDLLLTDMVMPGGMTGHQLAERAQLRNPKLRVLYISGYADPAQLRMADDPTRAWLQKPFTPDVLARTVHAILHP